MSYHLRTFALSLLGVTQLVIAEPQSYLATEPGVYLGAELYHHHYEEQHNGAFFMENSGDFAGIELDYIANTALPKLYYQLHFAYAAADLDYLAKDGLALSGAPNARYQYQAMLLHDMPVAANVTYVPYFGYGVRVLEDDKVGMSGTDREGTLKGGYFRRSTYHYVPVGLRAEIQTAANWMLEPYVQWQVFLQGEQQSNIGAILKNPQYAGDGYDLGCQVAIEVGRGQVRLGGFLRGWDIKQSASLWVQTHSSVDVITEPENSTREYGLRFAYHHQ